MCVDRREIAVSQRVITVKVVVKLKLQCLLKPRFIFPQPLPQWWRLGHVLCCFFKVFKSLVGRDKCRCCVYKLQSAVLRLSAAAFLCCGGPGQYISHV